MPRVFTAIPVPVPVQKQLTHLQKEAPGVQWQKPEHFHVTLNFIGQVNTKLIPTLTDVLDVVRRTPTFSLCCADVGHFGRVEAPTAFWVGVEPEQGLNALQQKLVEPLISHGFKPDDRHYHPHLTLGRHVPPEADARGWLERHSGFRSESFTAKKIVLFESRTDDNGLRYIPLATVTLNGHGEDAD